jgi:hypothetical protein
LGKYKLWTNEDVLLLQENNGKDLDILCKLITNHNRTQIIAKCKRENINYITRYNYWSDKEIELLKQCNNITLENIMNMFDKSLKSIIYKANELGVNIIFRSNPWTFEEDEILKQYSQSISSFSELCNLFSYRTESSIRDRFYKLGLRISDPNYVPISNTKKYRKDSSKINRYKKYGIMLDKDKLINTYDAIQWWKWFYHKTPNGKKLNNLPQEIYNDIDKLITIIKYVIENIIGLNTRDKLLELNVNLLNKYKINFKHNLIASIYGIINLTFPEYDIKPYELHNAPINYWKNKNNCDEYIEYILSDKICINRLNNLKVQLPSIFNFKNISFLKYTGLMMGISIYHYYESFYEWLNYLHPEYGLDKKDFNVFIALDGKTKLESMEEKLVFDCIYNDLRVINIKKITHKSKLFNEKENEYYIPDFRITKIEKIKLNKPVVIEYYGMYLDKPHNKIFQSYKDKTLRKNEFYKNNSDIYFIDLYPQDIKNQCEGVRQKITSFFMSNFNIDINSRVKEVI